MKLKKSSSVDYVHQFSDIAFMKFRPKKINIKLQEEKPIQQNSFVSKIKSLIGWQKSHSNISSKLQPSPALERSNSQMSANSESLQEQHPGMTIIFLEKITPQHFLIGNENQVDLVFIGGIVGNFIDTQSLWELNIGKPIKNLAVDVKSKNFPLLILEGYIAIETSTQIIIYQYDNKRLKDKPEFLTSKWTKAQGKYIRFIRDSVLTVFYQNFIEVYIIQENKMRKKICKQIKEASDMELFQVPSTAQNTLNVFYIRKSKALKTFQLWYLQLNLKGMQIEMTDLMKVYDIKEGLEKKIRLQNFSKEIFLMNLGFQILAVKKGYIIDSAYLNIQEESTFLHYIGNNRLLHLSPQKAQIYRFNISFAFNPPRIDITSLDSIEIKKPSHYEYIGSLEMVNRNFAVFYQIVPRHNKRTKGQITYCFAITRHVTIEQKVRQIFTFNVGKPLKDIQLDLIEERVDMARKIGLNRTQIYLQLWNRTNKTSVQEYKFLLDTLNYGTIRNEIEKKLKKSSMLWRQVYKIEQSCFQMIRQNLFSSRCTQDVVKQFLTSHFLLRKLQLYRDISIAQKKNTTKQDESDALKINIQNYNKYSKADIKTLFLQMIQQYCIDGIDVIMQIRIFLKSFRFIFRIIYKQLLQDIISTAKSKLIILLENFPQILPFKHILKDDDDAALYEGVWEDISRLQLERNLHIESIITIDNREVITQIPNSLWFRRNFLTLHDMTGKSKEQILKINKSNNSDEIFYFFISKVFEHIEQEEALNKVISFVQRNYEKMPLHIHQKIFLYRKIYNYFKDSNLPKSNQKLKDFHDLLQMRDFQLFNEFFQLQKIKKGCLLKDIKQIYEQVGGNDEVEVQSVDVLDESLSQCDIRRFKTLGRGRAWFNQGILSYFSSNLSQISDLKYILNRVNNAKIQFFIQNQHLIYVLVKSCQLKIRIGSNNDIPIDQIMLYLENIPLAEESPVLHQLTRIQKINQQVERFQQIKINMTISEIIKNCQNVINALIDQQIKKRHVFEIDNMQLMTTVSYDILAQIQVIKQKIYTLQYSDLTFFVYLTKIMQKVHMIPFAAELLKDPYLQEHYSIKQVKVVQDLILYMYKMKLSQNPKYIDNQYYLTNLLRILPEDNQCRIYITCELQYAKLLSAPRNPVQYPITDKMDGITIVQLEQRIHQLPGQFLLKIDVQQLHKLMNKMQQICYEEIEDGLYTSISQIYQIIILKLIDDNLIVQSLSLTKQLINLYGENNSNNSNQYTVVFPLFYINIISQQLTVECKKLLLRAVSFLFNQPAQLLGIVEQLIGKVFSSKQRNDYFKQLSCKAQQFRRNYNPRNPILDPIYLQLIRNQQMQNNFRNMIDQCGHHMVKTKQQFNTFQFSLLFIMMTQQPFALGKYIFCRRYHVNYKIMRSFLSYIIKQEIFSSIRVLQFGRRIFNIVLQASQSFLPFQNIASQYSNISMEENIEFQELLPLQPILPNDDEFLKKAKMLESKLHKCIIAFDKKKLSVVEQLTSHLPAEQLKTKRQRIQKQLTNPIDLSEKAPSQYPFGDSDDDYGQQEKFDDLTKSIRRKKTKNQFNPSLERNILLNRTSKNYALFMSTKYGDNSKQGLWISGKGGVSSGHNKPHKSLNAFALDGVNSLRFSLGQQQALKSQHAKSKNQSIHLSHQIGGLQGDFGSNSHRQGFTLTKSAVVKHTKSANLQQQQADENAISPSSSHSLKINDDNQQTKRNVFFTKNSYEQQQDKQPITLSQPQIQQEIGNIEDIGHVDFNSEFKVHVQEIDQDAFMPVQKIKTQIIQSVSEQSGEQFFVDFSQLSLQQEKNPAQFYNYLIDITKSIYNDQQIPSKTRLKLIKSIQNLYPDIGISKQYLQIYIRFQSYHSKYDIPLPMSEMFPIQFLFTNNKDPKHLFELVSPIIAQLVDDSNIYKISKIIHLAFKASSFEQQFFFSYLCMAAEKFDLTNVSQVEINMQLQKLTALIEKLPIHIILERGKNMVENMENIDRKDKLVAAMSNYLRKKKSTEEVKKFQDSLKKY